MGTIPMYSHTTESLEAFATQVKNLVMDVLCKEKILTDEQRVKYQENFAILVRNPGFWTRLVNMVKGQEGEANIYMVERK